MMNHECGGHMTTTKDLTGCEILTNRIEPRCLGISLTDGITLEGHVFLLSILPCCAQLALPYWAKVSGWLTNDREEEAVLSIMVTLIDENSKPLAEYSDVIAIEKGEKGTFDVKLIDFQNSVQAYTIKVADMEIS